MIQHDAATPRTSCLVFRYNNDLQRWERWSVIAGAWLRSSGIKTTLPGDKVLPYNSTWAEPYDE